MSGWFHKFDFDKKRLLNVGEFGNTYAVMSHMTSKTFAAKISKDFLNHLQFSKLQPLQHVNIVQYARCFIHNKLQYLMTPFSPLGSIHDIVIKKKTTSLDVDATCKGEWTFAILRGLRFLHESNPPICHGNLNSKNVIIFPSEYKTGIAKLSDYGISRKLNETTSNVKNSSNYLWTAPEVAMFGIRTTKHDVWSFGVTVVELYTERLPYHHLCLSTEKDFSLFGSQLNPLTGLPEADIKQFPRHIFQLFKFIFERDYQKRWPLPQLADMMLEIDKPTKDNLRIFLMLSLSKKTESLDLNIPRDVNFLFVMENIIREMEMGSLDCCLLYQVENRYQFEGTWRFAAQQANNKYECLFIDHAGHHIPWDRPAIDVSLRLVSSLDDLTFSPSFQPVVSIDNFTVLVECSHEGEFVKVGSQVLSDARHVAWIKCIRLEDRKGEVCPKIFAVEKDNKRVLLDIETGQIFAERRQADQTVNLPVERKKLNPMFLLLRDGSKLPTWPIPLHFSLRVAVQEGRSFTISEQILTCESQVIDPSLPRRWIYFEESHLVDAVTESIRAL